ncbi:hypothetical protein Scep_017161 [Stephania cephalantha]|uniref:Protein kinase domain-containing protein n=1 Tax=Stephania cephalantha TaxID=152367 RepID=A0AAP0IP03_9MAGN
MGCIASKHAVSITPAIEHSGSLRNSRNGGGGGGGGLLESEKKKKIDLGSDGGGGDLCDERGDSFSLRLGNLQKYVEGEQVAAGWPAWLSAVAGEAIQGWVPLRADSYEKLEKIGQGTYSSVFRARDLDTGKIVALKKVRFDNFEPESVRFMAREIMILRRLNHPNIVKLEGLITSRLSCSIYLVFEYMEHDLSGLSSCPDIKFSEAQVKCYMHQLLSGLEHCHSRGVMHRDIKGSNLLVNNEGILKIADFGLANYCTSGHKQPLTSRVVTLWYRPPELLLGSTDYGATVDLWSVGCVFAELFLGKPILQGRTEVEQLHKIFKLCGSPPDEYWKKSRLPHATIFKPQHPYESSLHDTCKQLPTTATQLIETLLSVEPYKRGTASSALSSEYFMTKPYACDPSTLPKYPPNKEIDAKNREEALRKKISGNRARGTEGTKRPAKANKPTRDPNGLVKSVPQAEVLQANSQHTNKMHGCNRRLPKEDVNCSLNGEPPKSSSDIAQAGLHMKNPSYGDISSSGPLQVTASSGFAWAKRRKEDTASTRSHSRSSSRGQVANALDPSSVLHSRTTSESKCQVNGDILHGIRTDSQGHELWYRTDSRGHDLSYRTDSKGHELFEISKHVAQRPWRQFDRPESFDAAEVYHSQELASALYQKDEAGARKYVMAYQDPGDKVEFSGPLLSQSHRVDELLEKHERHIRQVIRRSWFQRGKREGK